MTVVSVLLGAAVEVGVGLKPTFARHRVIKKVIVINCNLITFSKIIECNCN